VVSTRKQLDDDPKFNTLNKTTTVAVGFMQRQIENKKSRIRIRGTTTVAAASTIPVVISVSVVSSVRVVFRSAAASSLMGCERVVHDGMMGWDRNRPIFIWMTTVVSIHGSQLKPDSRSLVQQYPVPLCSLCSTVSIQPRAACSRCSITGVWIGVDRSQASRFRFCLTSTFLSSSVVGSVI